MNIICLSNQQWDYPHPTNKWHVMSRMAKLGHKVMFVDPPINAGRLFLRQFLRGQWGFGRILKNTYRDKNYKNVLVYSFLRFIPNEKLTAKKQVSKINKLSAKFFANGEKTVLWVYHVESLGLEKFISDLNYDTLVYDCVDNYTAFPENSSFYSTVVSKAKIEAQEEMLTKKADVVFATAPGLVDKLKKYREVVHFTPNVGDFEKFSKVSELKDNLPEDLKNIKRPRIGFTGSVDEYKFDKELVKKIAKEHSEFNFVIIGPIALKDREATAEELGFSELKNVHFLGSRPYSEIENYYAGFDAFIIPYQLNDYTVGGCFPIKFHDSLAAGLPTIVTDLPAYYPFAEVCYISKDYNEFSTNVERALKEDSPEKVKQRKLIASENNWDGKVQKLLYHINNI